MPTRPRAIVVATLFAWSLSAFRAANAQSAPPDSVRVARLASLGRLWGAVKYFHPALVTRPVDWDSALVAAIPRVRAAKIRAEFAAAVDTMLAALGDPLTHVVTPAAPSPRLASAKRTHLDWRPDSTLVVSIGDPADFPGTTQ